MVVMTGQLSFATTSSRAPDGLSDGTPPAIVQRMSRELQVSIAKPEIADSLRKQGVDPEFLPGPEFAARANADFRKWGDVIRERGIKAD